MKFLQPHGPNSPMLKLIAVTALFHQYDAEREEQKLQSCSKYAAITV
jgi:hypothetical protein